VREVEKRAREWHEDQEDETDEAEEEPKTPDPTPDRDDLQLDDFRSKLRSRLSTQIQINHKKDGEGTIEIAYYSEEDLERLVDLVMEE